MMTRLHIQVRAVVRVLRQLDSDPPPLPKCWLEWFRKAYKDLLAMAQAAADLQASERLSAASAANFQYHVLKVLGHAAEIWIADTSGSRKAVSDSIIASGRKARRILETSVSDAAAAYAKERRSAALAKHTAPADPICVDNSFWQEPSEW